MGEKVLKFANLLERLTFLQVAALCCISYTLRFLAGTVSEIVY